MYFVRGCDVMHLKHRMTLFFLNVLYYAAPYSWRYLRPPLSNLTRIFELREKSTEIKTISNDGTNGLLV